MKKVVFALIGGAQHGKDTICTELRNILPNCYPNHLGFADILKEQCKFLEWDGDKDLGGRQFLIDITPPIKKYGNWLAEKYPEKYGDYAGNNYYTAKLYDIIKNTDYNYYCISDMRFQCEYDFFKNKSEIIYIPIRVIRLEGGKYFNGGLTEEQLNSPSETELKNAEVSHTFNNFGTLEELKYDVKEWIIRKYLTQ